MQCCRHKGKHLFLLLTLSLTCLCALAEPPAESPPPSLLSKSEWLPQFKASFPNVFCEPNSYFRKCYNVTKWECENFTQQMIETCAEHTIKEWPETVTETQGGELGRQIGKCVTEIYQDYMNAKKKDLAFCKTSEELR